ncbi:3'(2'),5'-bisphosphate nucleotidase CysQ [Pseudochelatococcus lubricantis]|uniref:3'(2'),5'-bisphosphate nucleotidase CysQ family protein n=1 Tax=Pseudochelatococcus lubricantis TaxID=1538102 RepID=UPI0035ED0008
MPTPPDPRDFPPDGAAGDHRRWHEPAIRDRLAEHLGEIVRLAGGLILEAVARGFGVYRKTDGSSYTDADVEAERYILDTLAVHFPNVSVIAEEQTAARAEAGETAGDITADRAFFLVDPLDGTRDFTTGGLEYTVNLAAIVNGMPVAGAVYAPASGLLWIGGAHAAATKRTPYEPRPTVADWRTIHTRKAPPAGLTALASRRHGDEHTEEFLARLPVCERVSASSSVKFCVIAQGEADVYPRFGRTMEWDTAAGDAVLRAAGGTVVDPAGAPLTYGRARDGHVNGPFIAWGDPAAVGAFCRP